MPMYWRIATYLEPIGGRDEGAMIELASSTFVERAKDHGVTSALEQHAAKMKFAKNRIERARAKRRKTGSTFR